MQSTSIGLILLSGSHSSFRKVVTFSCHPKTNILLVPNALLVTKRISLNGKWFIFFRRLGGRSLLFILIGITLSSSSSTALQEANDICKAKKNTLDRKCPEALEELRIETENHTK